MLTPEEKEAMKLKHAEANAAKASKKADKKQKYDNKNVPVVEMRIPWETELGAPIDLDKPPWDSHPQALEDNWRSSKFLRDGNPYEGEVGRKIIRT